MQPTFLRGLASAAFLSTVIASAPAAVVTTADNESTPGDSVTSLLEAIQGLQDNETISFNIPGAGPHYIKTPLAGYPLIEKQNVTIDGYTQPGAVKNTTNLWLPNTSVIKIVLDSRDGGRLVIDYPGFGLSESAVLALLDATNFRARGLGFVGVAGQGSDEDPSVYCIALIKDSIDAKIQGCWFGLDPAAAPFVPDASGIIPGVHGARSAVASFRWDDDNVSEGLIIGTDSDGAEDNSEFNIMIGQRLAIHLQTPEVRVSGNYINYLPDGRVFSYETQQLELEDGSYEAIENGGATNMVIGTNGDGTNDANESNFIGPVNYDVYVEFWRSATGIVIAGNYFGVGPDGWPSYLNTQLVSLVQVRNNSDIRIGSDLNGTADLAEANHIYGLNTSFINFHGSNANDPNTVVRISLRGNDLIDNYGDLPLDKNINVAPEILYGLVLADPFSGYRPVLDPTSTVTSLKGMIPPPLADTVESEVELDVYLVDLSGRYRVSDDYPYGFLQGRLFLAKYVVDGAGDLDPLPAAFSFDVSALGLTAAELQRLVVTANYTLVGDLGAGPVVTSNFSETLAAVLTPPPPLTLTTASLSNDMFQIAWTGGIPPFVVESSANLVAPWSAAATTPNQTATLPVSGPARYFRVHENALPRWEE